MADLFLRVKADYQDAVRCREELKKVEAEMKNLDSSASPQKIADLTRKYNQLAVEWENHMSAVGRTGVFIKEAFQQIGKAVKDTVDSSTAIGNSSKSTREALERRLQVEERIADVLKRQREEAERQVVNSGIKHNNKVAEYNDLRERLDKKYKGKGEGFYDEADTEALRNMIEELKATSQAWEDSNTRLQVYDNLLADSNERTEKMKNTLSEVTNVYKGFADTVESSSTKIFLSEEVFNRYHELSNRIEELKGQIKTVGEGNDIDIPRLRGLQEELAVAQEEFRSLDSAARNTAAVLGNDLAGKVSKALENLYGYNDYVRKTSDEIKDFEEKLKAAKKELAEAKDPVAVTKAREEIDKLQVSLDDASDRLTRFKAKQVDALGEIEKLRKQVEGGGVEKSGDINVADEVTDQVKGVMGKIAAMAGIGFGLSELKDFFSQARQWREYFQDIESSMKVFLGSAEKGAEFTAKLKDYAYYNMFEFSDLAAASQQMISYGHNVESIIPRLDQLSNVATGTHGSLMELVDAYNRAKATGVVGARDIQSWAVKGVMIRDVLRDMGEAVNGTTITFDQLNKVLDKVTGEGGQFHGLMLEMMDNISAESGQLEDNLAAMYEEIGSKFEGVFVKYLKLQSAMAEGRGSIVSDELLDWGAEKANAVLDDLLENWQKYIGFIKDAVAAYGIYRVALIANNALEKVSAMWKKFNADAIAYKELMTKKETAAKMAETVAEGANTAATNVNTGAKVANAKATDMVSLAMVRLRTALMAHPFALVVAGLAAVAYACYAAYDSMMTQTKAQKLLNDVTEDYNDKTKEQEQKDRENIRIIQDKTASIVAQTKAYKDLINARSIFAKYSPEEIAKMSASQIDMLLGQDNAQKNEERLRNQVEVAKELQNMFNGKGAAWLYAEESDIDAVVKKFKLLPEYAEKLKNSIGGTTNLNDWSEEMLKATSEELQKYLSENAETGIVEGFRKGFTNTELRASSSQLIADYANAIENATGNVDKGLADKYKKELQPALDEAQKKFEVLNNELSNATGDKKTKIEAELKAANDDISVLQSIMAFFEAGVTNKELVVDIKRNVENANLDDDFIIAIGKDYEKIDDLAAGYMNRLDQARVRTNDLGVVSIEQAQEIAKEFGLTGDSIEEDFGNAEKSIEGDISELENKYKNAKTDIERNKIKMEIARKKEQLDYIRDLKKKLKDLVQNPYNIMVKVKLSIEKKIRELLGLDETEDENKKESSSQKSKREKKEAEERNKPEQKTPTKSSKDYLDEEKREERERLSNYRKYKSGKGTIEISGKKYDLANLTAEDNDKLKTYFKGAEQLLNKSQKETKEALQRKQRDYDTFLKNREQQIAQEQKANDAAEEARIAGIKNDALRERAERENQFRLTLRQINEQEESFKKANVERQKAEWSNKKENKNKIWANTAIAQDIKENGYANIALTDDQAKQIKEQRNKAALEEDRYRDTLHKKEQQAWWGYLEKYGTFQQRKLALAEEYAEKIRQAQESGDVIGAATLMREQEQKASDLRLEEIKSQIDWEGVFHDLNMYSKEYLEGLRVTLSNLMKDPALKPEDAQVIGEKLGEIDNVINEKAGNTFRWVNSYLVEQKRLLSEADAAYKAYQQAMKEEIFAKEEQTQAAQEVAGRQMDIATLFTQMGGDEVLPSEITEGSEARMFEELGLSLDDTSEQAITLKAAFEELKNAMDNLTGANAKVAASEQKTEKAKAKSKNADEKTDVKLKDRVAGFMKGLNEDAQKYLGDLPDLLGTLGMGKASEKVQKGLNGINDAAGAAADFASGNYVGAALKGINAVNNFGEALGVWSSSNRAEVEAANKKLEIAMGVNTEAVNRLTSAMEKQNPEDAFKSYEQAVAALKANEEAERRRMENNTSMYDGGHSLNYDLDDAGGVIQQIFRKLNKTTSGGYSIGDLIHALSAADWNRLYEDKEGQDLLRKLGEAIAEAEDDGNYNGIFQDILNFANTYSDDVFGELANKFNTAVTQVSFDSMYSSFVSSLMDMNKKASEFSNDFESYLRTAIYEAMAVDQIKPMLQQWYKAFAAAMKSKETNGKYLSQEEINNLMREGGTYTDENGVTQAFSGFEAIKNAGLELRNAVEELGLYNGTDQTATSKSIQNITYEQADDLVGRITAGQILWEHSLEQQTLLNAKVDQLFGGNEPIRNIAADSRDILAGMAIDLSQIKDGVMDTIVPRIRNIDSEIVKVRKAVEAQ